MNGRHTWLLVLAAAACRGPGPTPAPTPPAGAAPASTTPRPPEPAKANPAAVPPLAAPNPPPTAVAALPSGLTVAWGPEPPGGLSIVQLGLPTGTRHGAPGLAELAVEILVASSDATQGRPSLRQAVRELGGTLFVDQGPVSTWLTLEVPIGRWAQALQALGRALAAPTLSRHQLERLREAYLDQRIAAVWRERNQEAARALLLGAADTNDYLAGLLDRDVGELPLFAARRLRPRGAVLTLRVPGPPTEPLAEAPRALADWLAAGSSDPAPAAAAAAAQRPFPNGLAWSPAAGTNFTELSVVLPLPEGDRGDEAPQWAMVACLVRDGRSGRLATVQQEQGLGHLEWRSRVVGTGDRTALLLTASAPPEVAYRLWQCFDTARRSLASTPPSDAEFATAARSAALVQRLAAPDRRTALRAEAWQRMTGSERAPLATRLAELPALPLAERQRLAQWLATQPIAGIAIGGTVPAKATDVRTFELLPPGALARLLGGGAEPAQAAAAAPWLDDALAAVGGRNLVQSLRGFRATATRTAAQAPTAEETVDWLGPGQLRRERKVLGKAIVTTLAADAATESLGDQTQPLTAADVARLCREHERHPLLLLAAYARGELQFRPVSQRRSGDRELMVLEALGNRFDRLRIHLDVASHLIRVVEVWEVPASGAVTYLQELWSDYRNCGGLRAPHHCVTEIDDSTHRVEWTVREWQPQFAAKR